MSSEHRGVLIVDLGTQYTQLIARRVREAGTWCQITIPGKALEAAAGMNLGGIILSGGPASVYDDDAPVVPQEILELDVPVLGICYGMQWMCRTLGGEVKASNLREYGRVSMRIVQSEGPFRDIGGHTVVWMSHGDSVAALPAGFETYAESEDCPSAAVGDPARNLWGVQFHPEVSHSVRGREVLDNFLTHICGLQGDWKPDSIVDREIAKIHEIFVEVFREEAKAFKNAGYLGQGTLYPDVIESVNVHGGNTAVIKSHHNVGGLPEDLDMELVEPLRELFKDEVRTIGRFLGLDSKIVDRQPFPGPGLAVRIIGEVTPDKVALLQEADHICTTEIEKTGEHLGLWQYFAVLLPVQSVGVMGDFRTYENACALRIVESADGMTADWGYLSRETLQSISSKIINRVRGINRVVLDVSSKPPSTIEWE
ncbi:UNVERIFIED_CONTAM: hypothetical protein GTU68_048445 [Idotea baltica]|nr:hypothetical protein [Idotea baltica]